MDNSCRQQLVCGGTASGMGWGWSGDGEDCREGGWTRRHTGRDGGAAVMVGAWSRNKRAARDLACRVTDRPSLSRSRGEWRARAGGEMLPSSIIAECLSSRAASAAAPAASLHHSLISIMSSVYSAGPSSASRQTSADCSRLDVLPCRSCRTLPTSCFTPTAPKKRRELPTTTTVFV